ncbi:MAG: TIGR02679 family protein [Actinomycetota bacterium]
MKAGPDIELNRLIASPGVQRLFQRARVKLERDGLETHGTVSLPEPTPEERKACARMLGSTPSDAGVLRVSLERLDHALRESRHSKTLREVLELQGGPLEDRRDASQRAARAATAMWSNAFEHVAVKKMPELEQWLERLRSTGLIKRVADGQERQVLEGALLALEVLPADGLSLGVLAATVAGDAHALDNGRPLATVVMHALASLKGERFPSAAAERRRLWADFGVVCDELSCDVLTLGLAPVGRGRVAHALRELSASGEPLRLTLRQLLRSGLRFENARAFVCENPVVVAAASDRLGGSCPALVCSDGIPNTAAMTLLRQLSAGGAGLAFHADFDWGGIRVGNVLANRLGAAAWRFSAGDYLEALEGPNQFARLSGSPMLASWDEALATQMSRATKAVYEEQTLEALLEDLKVAFK